MAEYLSVIITVSLFSAIIKVFLNEKGTSKSVNTVISVVVLACIIVPIINVLLFFKDNYAVPVINDSDSHIIDNKEEDIMLYRKWLAEATADEVSFEIEEAVKKYTGIDVEIECPWHFEGENVIFDVLLVYTNCDVRYYEKIKNTIKLHYKLDSKCIKL